MFFCLYDGLYHELDEWVDVFLSAASQLGGIGIIRQWENYTYWGQPMKSLLTRRLANGKRFSIRIICAVPPMAHIISTISISESYCKTTHLNKPPFHRLNWIRSLSNVGFLIIILVTCLASLGILLMPKCTVGFKTLLCAVRNVGHSFPLLDYTWTWLYDYLNEVGLMYSMNCTAVLTWG